MSKVTQVESLSPNNGALDSFLGFALQAMVVETAIVATKSVAWLLMMMGTLPNGLDVFIKEPEVYAGFPLAQLLAVRKPGPENKDASDTEDDDDEEDEAADDQDEDGGEEEDGSGEEAEDKGDPEDGPVTNGDGGSGDEDDEDEDDDDDDDDDEDDDDGEEEEEEEEEEEKELQPPAKKRK